MPDVIKHSFKELIGADIRSQFDNVLFESEGIYCVEDDDCFFYVDSTGSAVSEKYHDLNPFINGVCRAQRSDLEWVNINRQDLKV